jgi:hypothetical protein
VLNIHGVRAWLNANFRRVAYFPDPDYHSVVIFERGPSPVAAATPRQTIGG